MILGDPAFYLAAVPAILIAGISKGGFGGGLGILAVPLLALTVTPAQAAAIVLPILVLMDAIGIRAYRRRIAWPVMVVMLPGAVLGIIAGSLAFGLMSERLVRVLIGVLALAFVAQYLLGAPRRSERPPPRWFGALAGALSGFTSTLAHAGGPPAAMYLLPLRLDKTVFVASTVLFFAVINLLKLPAYFWLGQFTTENLATALVLAPLAPAGMYLGMWLHARVAPLLFYRICYGCVAITGVKLVWDGVAG